MDLMQEVETGFVFGLKKPQQGKKLKFSQQNCIAKTPILPEPINEILPLLQWSLLLVYEGDDMVCIMHILSSYGCLLGCIMIHDSCMGAYYASVRLS